MNNPRPFQRRIAIILLAIFLPSLLPVNLLYASNNGPNAPESQGFEAVTATDMVNLSSGDMSYVLPLMEVNGFPITMSYHGGIPLDLESSWVGLGWNLNTGAINRNLNASPDDWNGGNSLDFIKYKQSEDIYNVNVGIGVSQCLEAGVGMSWGSNKGVSGSVYAQASLYGYAGVSGSIDTNGNYGLGAFAGYKSDGGTSYGVGVGASGNVNGGKTNYSVGAGVRFSSGLTMGMSTSLNGNGTSASLGYSNSSGSGLNTSGGGAAGSLSLSSFSQGDWDVTSKGWYIPIQIYCFTVGFGHRKITYNLEQSYSKKGYGMLYSNSISTAQDNSLPDNVFSDYQNRYKYSDAYDQALPQSEKEFIGDYDLEREKLNFTFAGYDHYDVNATGISGLIQPRQFENASLFGMGYLGANPLSTDQGKQRIYYHNGNVSRKTFGTGQSSDIEFYFNGQFVNNRTVNPLVSTTNNLTTGNSLNNILTTRANLDNSISQQGNFVEVFTNDQIKTGYASSAGLLNPVNVNNNQRQNDQFIKDGIGGYKISAPDGKVYHFSLPVYHYEQIQRTIYKDSTENHVSEKRQYTSYATHWLLTTITGPDYFDVNNNNIADEGDYGYWTRLDHGKWSDGYVWRNPTDKKLKEYFTNIEGNIGKKDFGFYEFGRKQLYYLDKIVSPTQTAFFVKDLRYDSAGCDLNYYFTGDNYINNSGFGGGVNKVTENFVYKRQMQLMLKKIILVNNDVANEIKNNINIGNNPLLLNNQNVNDYIDSYSPNYSVAGGFYNEFGNNYSIKINQEQNIIDVKDFESFDYSKALKIVDLSHNYNLAVKNHNYILGSNLSNGSPGVIQNTSINPNNGKLTLKAIKFLGKSNFDYMPPYQFEYDGEFVNNMLPYVEYPANSIVQKKGFVFQNGEWVVNETEIPIRDIRAKDDWGFRKERPEAWTMTKISTPTGSSINFEHEEDDFYTEAFSRRYWTEDLMFKVNNSSGNLFIEVRKRPDAGVNIDFSKYFSANDQVFLDLWLCHTDEENCIFTHHHWTHSINIESGDECYVQSVTNNNVILKVPITSHTIPSSETANAYNTFYARGFPTIGSNKYYELPRGNCVNIDGGCGGGKALDHTLKYRFLASKVPLDETGGGLRVKSITLKDENNNKYKTSYYYNVPGTNKVKNLGNYKSSGITSYSPVKGTKFIPYQSELPSPGVMYEYVTMVSENSGGQSLGETRYRFYTLRPVLDIFNENIEMKYDNGEMMFKVDVDNSQNSNNGYFDLNKKIKSKSINVKVNTSLVGQFRSVEDYNIKGQLMKKVEKNYLSGTTLKALANLPTSNLDKVYRGTIKESFQSMKSIYTANSDDNNPNLTNRLLSISSKEEFPSVLLNTKSVTPYGITVEEYKGSDPMTGTFNIVEKQKADGKWSRIERIPAYTKYPQMGSKVNNISNKHMLTQDAMNITSVKVGNVWKTTSANVTTWNDTWAYRNETNGIDNVDNIHKVWRKHKTFSWKENLDSNGAYQTSITKQNSQFNWGLGTPLSDKWQKLSEVTRYTRWSMPIETKDINGNFASTKMGDNDTKVLVSGNARYSEMYYSGAEYVKQGNLFDGEVKGASFRTPEAAHTGNYSVKASTVEDKVFEVTGNSGDVNYYQNQDAYSSAFRPGKYKVSFWAYKSEVVLPIAGSGSSEAQSLANDILRSNNLNYSNYAKLDFNGVDVPVSEVVNAGCWQQLNYYIDILPNNSNSISVKARSIFGTDFYDDFRIHPIASSISSYVYEHDTDQLSYVLDGNNMGSAYKYDLAGRIKSNYTEIEDNSSVSGGFKITSQFKQNYKGSLTSVTNEAATIDNCYNINQEPLNVNIKNECIGTFENKFHTYVSGGSGNFSYDYKWKVNYANGTFSNYISGTSEAFIPYVPKYCTTTSDPNTFSKIWSFVVRVTDLNTGQVIETPYEYGSGSCDFSIGSKIWADIQISNCSNYCTPDEFAFKIHLKDIGYQDNFKYEYAYYDPDTYFYTQNFNWIDVTSTQGRFCPEFVYMVDNTCNIGYRKVVYFTYRVTNLNTGHVSYWQPNVFMGECGAPCGNLCKIVNGSEFDLKYAEYGNLLVKDQKGTGVISAYNVKQLTK